MDVGILVGDDMEPDPQAANVPASQVDAVLTELGRYKGSFDERVLQAQQDDSFDYDLSQIHPLTRQYLQLKIGR